MKNKIVKSILVFALIFIIGGSIWVNITYSPNDMALNHTVSTENVDVIKEAFGLSFIPVDKKNTSAIIFYPGAKVEPKSYSPLAFKLAEKGYMTIIVEMPLNLAVLDPDRGKEIMRYYEGVEQWYIGGHSLGGAMAGNFAHEYNQLIAGVFFLGAYPVKDLSADALDVLLVNGSLDTIINKERLKAAENLIPKDSTNKMIQGANHSQFGSYGLQKKDQQGEISFEKQQKKTIELIVGLIERKD